MEAVGIYSHISRSYALSKISEKSVHIHMDFVQKSLKSSESSNLKLDDFDTFQKGLRIFWTVNSNEN